MAQVLCVIAHPLPGSYPRTLPPYLRVIPHHIAAKLAPPPTVQIPCTRAQEVDFEGTVTAMYRDAFAGEAVPSTPHGALIAMLAADEGKFKTLIPYVATISANHGVLTTHPWFTPQGAMVTANINMRHGQGLALVLADAEAASFNPELFYATHVYMGEYAYTPIRHPHCSKHHPSARDALALQVNRHISNHNAVLNGIAFCCEVNAVVNTPSEYVDEPPTCGSTVDYLRAIVRASQKARAYHRTTVTVSRNVWLDDVYPDMEPTDDELHYTCSATQVVASIYARTHRSQQPREYATLALGVALETACKRPGVEMFVVIP